MPCRRDVLRTGGLAVAGGLAGCSARSPELTLWNVHEQPHTATVLLFEDGNPVYRATLDAQAADGSQAGGGEFEGYLTEPGQYELYGWHEHAASHEWARLAFDPESLSVESKHPPCVEVIFMIEAGQSGGAHSQFLRNVGCDGDDGAQSSK